MCNDWIVIPKLLGTTHPPVTLVRWILYLRHRHFRQIRAMAPLLLQDLQGYAVYQLRPSRKDLVAGRSVGTNISYTSAVLMRVWLTCYRPFDGTNSSSCHSALDGQSRNPRVAASTAPRNSRKQDRDSPDYLECPFFDCEARFKGISKHRPSNLRKHIRITHAKDPVIWKCPDSSCTSTFNRQYNLRAHWRTFHKGRTVAELGLPFVTQKRKKPGRVKKIAGDMMK